MRFEKWMWNPLEWIRLRRWLKKARHMTFNEAWYETWKHRPKGKINHSLMMGDILQKVLKGYPLSIEQEICVMEWRAAKPENAALHDLMKNPEAYYRRMKEQQEALIADLHASGYQNEAEYARAMKIIAGHMMNKQEAQRLEAMVNAAPALPEITPAQMDHLWGKLEPRLSTNQPNKDATK